MSTQTITANEEEETRTLGDLSGAELLGSARSEASGLARYALAIARGERAEDVASGFAETVISAYEASIKARLYVADDKIVVE